MDGSELHGYRFGTFELDVRSGDLKRRGQKTRLRGRPIEILTLLLRRQGEVVSREELRAQLWTPDTFVDFDHGLHSAMNKLREGLGDAADNPRFIETVPRRGYRFIAPVTVVPLDRPRVSAPTPAPVEPSVPIVATPPPRPMPARPLRRGATVAVIVALFLGFTVALAVPWLRTRNAAPATTGRVMLVVLPFDNLSGDREQDFFSDGFTDELIAQLGSLDPRRLGVIARTTALHYKRSGQDVMSIGQALGVDYLLEGSVRRDARRVRITAQFVDVKSQTQLWTETYERDVEDVLMLQRDVAMRLAQSLAGGVLSPVLARAPAASAPPFDAYELVLRARALRQQATEAGARGCVSTYEEAIRRAPEYAPAHAGLADCYRLLGAPGWEAGPPGELLEHARRAAERALALDPSLAEAYAVRAMVRFNLDWDLEAADRDLARALSLNPSLARAHQYRSAVLTAMSRFDEAVDAARRAQQLDPMSAIESTTLGVRLYYAGRHAEAVQQFTRTLQMHPDFAVAAWGLGEAYREQGRHDQAIAELRRAVKLSSDSAYMRAWLAHGLASAGQRTEAEAIRRDIAQLARERYVSPFLMTLMASGFGERAATIEWLAKTAETRSGWMPFVPVEPQFQWLRGDPAFQQLVARVRPR